MTSDLFMANFGHIANAPGGVGKLRDLIYHFAFAGELVAHSRESAAELAKVLAQAESPTGRTRRAMLESAVGFYPIPDHWLWVNIGDVGHDWGQTKPSGDFTYIDVSAIDNHRGVVAEGASIVSAANAPSRARKVVKKGTVIYSTVRPYLLNIAVIEQDFDPAPIASTAFAILHPHDGVEAKFVYYFLRSPAFVAYVEGVQSGIAYPAISDQKFFAASFPLAPAEEQKRIVAKVDELMALCDQLEAQQQERERRFPVLSRTCHARFAEAPTPANLNRIFDETGTVSPADLRKTVLTLAIQGKLLPQDSGDENVDELLSKVLATKARLQAEGKIGKEKPYKVVQPTEPPFVVPETWRWVKLVELTELITKGSSPKWQGINYVPTSGGVLFITSENVGNYQLRKLDELKYVESRFNELEPRSILKRGDILMNLVGASIGRAALYDLADGANINQAVALIRLVGEIEGVDPSFLLHYLNSPTAIDYMLSSRVVNAQPNISLTDAREFPIPLPPLAEQRRIVVKVDELMVLADRLEAQQHERDQLAEAFARACVASFTGNTQIEKPEKMKAPKTELVSLVTLGKKPKPDTKAPLAQLLGENKGTLPAKSLWQQSGLTIDSFYQQLKTEIAQGWIAPPAEAEMKVVEESPLGGGTTARRRLLEL